MGYALFQCQLALNQLSAASDTLEVVLESIPAGVGSLLPRAELAIARKDFPGARALIAELNRLNPTHPLALRRLGLLLLRLRDWEALEQIATRALDMDKQDSHRLAGTVRRAIAHGQTEGSRRIGDSGDRPQIFSTRRPLYPGSGSGSPRPLVGGE